MNALRRAELAAAFTRQADLCAAFAAPFYADLCRRCAADVAADGPIAHLVAAFAGDPAKGSLPLRVLAAVHARVQAGTAPTLAAAYAAPAAHGPSVFDAFSDVVAAEHTALVPWLDHPPQTNEVGRAALLVAGLQTIAGDGQQRLHLRELGSSAGLLLRCDRYGYRLGGSALGDASSAVQITPDWQGPAPPSAPFALASRRGCDLRPLDVGDEAACARLCAFVWPEHAQRLANLRAALAIARAHPVAVDCADAIAWLPAQLAARPTDGATVVFHSSVWGYLPAATQQSIAASIAAAAANATATAPLHWLRWEDPPGEAMHELRLCSWPGARDRLLARGTPHGVRVQWLVAT